MQKLNFISETIDEMKTRFLKAVSRVYTFEDIKNEIRPAFNRDNVFDFNNGLRLIVSLDRASTGITYRHISASFIGGFELEQLLTNCKREKGLQAMIDEFRKIAFEKYIEISGDFEPFIFDGISKGKGIPHWHRVEKNAP